jgi:ammonia channel protein AmtB
MPEGFLPATHEAWEWGLTGSECTWANPWDQLMGPNMADNVMAVFWAAFLLFSWTTGSIMSGAVIERIRITAYLVLTVVLGAFVWVLGGAWGWSWHGWLVVHFGFHDFAASGVVHGIAGLFALGVLLNLGPRLGKYDRDGGTRQFLPHNLHMTLMGLMIIFTAFYAFYAACLAITPSTAPGWTNIYGNPTTLGAITFTITVAFAGGFLGGYIVSKGDPFWTLSGGLAGVVAVSAGADVYHPSLTWLLAIFGAVFAYKVGTWQETKMRVDDAVGAVAVHGWTGFLALILMGIFGGGFPTGYMGASVEVTLLGQLVGVATLMPLAFISGYVVAWLLKKGNLLRVPVEVEITGIDKAEFGMDFFPDHQQADETIVMADGTTTSAAPVLQMALNDVIRG